MYVNWSIFLAVTEAPQRTESIRSPQLTPPSLAYVIALSHGSGPGSDSTILRSTVTSGYTTNRLRNCDPPQAEWRGVVSFPGQALHAAADLHPSHQRIAISSPTIPTRVARILSSPMALGIELRITPVSTLYRLWREAADDGHAEAVLGVA
jgi:hypothetical protein